MARQVINSNVHPSRALYLINQNFIELYNSIPSPTTGVQPYYVEVNRVGSEGTAEFWLGWSSAYEQPGIASQFFMSVTVFSPIAVENIFPEYSFNLSTWYTGNVYQNYAGCYFRIPSIFAGNTFLITINIKRQVLGAKEVYTSIGITTTELMANETTNRFLVYI